MNDKKIPFSKLNNSFVFFYKVTKEKYFFLFENQFIEAKSMCGFMTGCYHRFIEVE